MGASLSDQSVDDATVRGPTEPQHWKSLPFPEALLQILSERQITLVQLSQVVDVPIAQLESVIDGDAPAPLGVIEIVASGLRVEPWDFLDYRLAAALGALSRDPDRANQLFLVSLSEFERRGIDSSDFDNRSLRATVKTLLSDEQMDLGELAEGIGESQTIVSAVINGKRPLDADTPARIADLLGVQPECLLAYRLAALGEWLRSHPHEVDSLLGERRRRLAFLSSGAHVESFAGQLALQPYQEWPVSDLTDPMRVSVSSLAQDIVEIVDFEGPVLVRRVYRLRLFAAGITPSAATRGARAQLERAFRSALRNGYLTANEEREGAQKSLALRWPGSPQVVVRQRGERTIAEVPVSELAALVAATQSYTRRKGVQTIQNEVFQLYEVARPEASDFERVNWAINLAGGV